MLDDDDQDDGVDQQEAGADDEEHQLLFSQVMQGQVSMQSIVDDWIEAYKKSKETAMLDLIKFVIRCSGCKMSAVYATASLSSKLNSKELLRTKEFAETISELSDAYNEHASTCELYPLVQTSVQARRFKANFAEFLQLLVNQCQYSIVYDQFMFDVLIAFLVGMADSQVRAFRHTASLACLKIMTALVTISLITINSF